MRRACLPLLLAAALSGCAAPEGLGLGASEDGAREPYYKEWREWVEGSHLRVFEVDVEPGARLLNASVLLAPRTNGVPAPGVALARLDLTLTAPDGAPLLEAEVDAQRRAASLVVADPAPGTYLVQVSGMGSSQEIDGTRYGDAYTLAAEVVYG